MSNQEELENIIFQYSGEWILLRSFALVDQFNQQVTNARSRDKSLI